jgi:hypothetical protein
MIRNAILGAGVVLSSASQFRLPGLPIGMGEVCLALWIGLSLTRLIAGYPMVASAALTRMSVFWVVFALTLSIGACIGVLFDPQFNLGNMIHDAMAYLLIAFVTILVLVEPDSESRLRQAAWFVVIFGNIGLALQIAIGWGLLPQGSLEPWYWDRFRGWSENPNQAALYCAALGPLALHLAMSAEASSSRFAGFALAILPVIFGRLTKSDAFLIATVISTIFLIGLRLRTWLAVPGTGLRYIAAVLFILAAPPTVITLLPYGIATAGETEGFAKSLTKDKGGDGTVATANLRLLLWKEALIRGGESASFGLGPGPHSERPTGPNPGNKPGPFEAHSTPLDLYTQGGVLGLAALMWLGGSTLWLTLQARFDALSALICCLAVFSLSHFILRHPIFWFALALCLAEGCTRRRTASAHYGR